MNDMKDIIDEIKSRCDISSIISEYMEIKQSGSNFKGLCPFHGEKTPSFHINTSKQIYKCFGCGEGGDVINFVMKMENLDFMDSVKLLASKSGIEINTNISKEAREKIEKSKRFQDVYTEAARFYFSNLTESKNNGYTYLRNRGLSDKIIKRFGLGYSKDSWSSLKDFMLEKNYNEDELLECGLILRNKDGSNTYDRFRNRVMFPIFDYRGNIIAFGGRTLDSSIPKYLNSPETLIFNKRENLYGLNFARKKITDRTIILVEGYMDLISLVQYGVENVCATLGTALTEQQSSLIKRYADSVVISYDSDSAGIQATIRAIDILIKSGLNVKVINLRDSKDPDEFIRKYGFDEYKKEIQSASHYIKFKIDDLRKNYNFDRDEQRVKYIKDACQIIKTLKSPIDTDYYISYLSNLVGINVDSINREVYGNNYNKSYKNKSNNKIKEKPIEKVEVRTDGKIQSEKVLLKIMLENRKIRELILLKIGIEDFLSEKSKEILNFIIKNKEMDKITIDKKENFCIDEEYIEDIKSISLINIDFDNEKEIDEIVNTVKRNTLEMKIEDLLREQRELENNHDAKEVDGRIMEIALKIVEINKVLKSL